MSELAIQTLLETKIVTLRDVACSGSCRHRSPEECASDTHMVFPYRGVYVRHVGRIETVAEANQVVFFNRGESYQISHPVAGGDECLSLAIDEPTRMELASQEPNEQRRRLTPDAQTLLLQLRHRLVNQLIGPLEAESMALALAKSALGERAASGTVGKRKLVERAKLVLASDLARRWTLADVAAEVGVSPVYLTQLFKQVERMPLYRYQMRLRLARALELLERGQAADDISALSMDLGFSSHSHFTATFRQAYGCTPVEFLRSVNRR
ncbi:MAG: helix-turn-helix transcriptional regulator [Proteobacteria bacterium]|nr:helix-turn-helix transcriptional regulator [Pseudomonadota bacterium]